MARLDLHMHTSRHSRACSVLEPRTLVRKLVEKGLDGGVITEHEYTWSQSELDRLLEECGNPDLVLLAGREMESDLGHLLIFGPPAPVSDLYRAMDIADQVHEAGGVVIWAHPFRWGRNLKLPDARLLEWIAPLDGIEALTANQRPEENRRARKLAETHGITATGASDAHEAAAVAANWTEFPHPIRTIGDLTAALRAGKCRPSW